MAGQINQWMKDGGFDLEKFLSSIGGAAKDTAVGAGRTLGNSLNVIGARGYDAARRGVYGAAGLQPNDPDLYTNAADAQFADSTRQLAGPTRSAIEFVQNKLGSARQDLNNNLAATGSPAPMGNSPMSAEEMLKIYENAPGAAQAPGAQKAAPVDQPAPTRRISSGALPQTPAQIDAPRAGALPQQSPLAPIGKDAPAVQDMGQGEQMQQAPEKTLADLFNERMSQIPEVELNKITPDQKQQLALQFFLNLMARGGEANGKSVLGNIGDSGIDTLNSSRVIQNQNNINSTARRTRDTDNAFKSLSLAQQDNMNSIQKKHYEVMEQRIRSGKWKVQETSNGMILIDPETGQTKPITDEQGKPIQLSGNDGDTPEIKLLKYWQANPKALAISQGMKGKDGGGDSDKITQKDRIKMILDYQKGGDEFNPRSLDDSTAAVDSLLGRNGSGQKQAPRPTGDAALANFPPEIQKQAIAIRNLMRSGKMTQEDGVRRLNALGIR